MSEQLGIVSDIHGDLGHLHSLLEKVGPTPAQLVFVGDYVDRGAQSAEVLDSLIRLGSNRPCTFLAGNHDLAMLAALEDDGFDPFLQLGGARTVRSYVRSPFGDVAAQFRASVPAEHVKFLSGLKPSFETGDLVVTHDSRSLGLIQGNRFGVCGHSPQYNGRPSITAKTAHIDTGCGTVAGGRLTCLFWPSLRWVQSRSSNQDGG